MRKYTVYKNQVLPDVLNTKQTTFKNHDEAIKELKKAIKSKKTIFAYCCSADDTTGEIELQFNDLPNIIGYVLLEDMTYDKIHIGKSITCVDNIVGVRIKELEELDNGFFKVKCSRKEVVKKIHDTYNKDIDNGIFKAELMVKGVVTGMDFNKVYVDIGGDVTAILGVADISRVYVKQPSDMIKNGDVLDLVIKKLYSNPIKISLSRSMLISGWETIDTRFRVGKIVPGIVKNRMATGLFIELSESFEGLAEDIPPGVKYSYGDRVKVNILVIDKKREKIKLRIIQNK